MGLNISRLFIFLSLSALFCQFEGTSSAACFTCDAACSNTALSACCFNCTAPFDLSLSNNQLSGAIPPSLLQMSGLLSLDLSNNELTGGLGDVFVSGTNLTTLDLSSNPLGGNVPASLASLAGTLKVLRLADCNLNGSAPNYEALTALSVIDLSSNQLVGSITHRLASLTVNLRYVDLSNNNIDVAVSTDLSATTITHLDLSFNSIPSHPNIGGSASALASSLVSLMVNDNAMSGGISNNVGQLAQLQHHDFSNNQISSLSNKLDESVSLQKLIGNNNNVNNVRGSKLLQLTTTLTTLELANNAMAAIPASLGSVRGLVKLDLSAFVDSGSSSISLPAQLGSLSLLTSLSVGSNQLTSSNVDLSLLSSLVSLDMSNNQLGGAIPTGITAAASSLQNLDLSNNLYTGGVPESFGTLTALQLLDLGGNSLSGQINESLCSVVGVAVTNCDLSGMSLTACGVSCETTLTGTSPSPGPGLCGVDPCLDCEGVFTEWSNCSVSCGAGTQTRAFNVVTPASGGGSCNSTETRACPSPVPCPVDCVGSWGAWGSCNSTCGSGSSFRSFSVSTPAQNGGFCLATDGDQESQPCEVFEFCLQASNAPVLTSATSIDVVLRANKATLTSNDIVFDPALDVSVSNCLPGIARVSLGNDPVLSAAVQSTTAPFPSGDVFNYTVTFTVLGIAQSMINCTLNVNIRNASTAIGAGITSAGIVRASPPVLNATPGVLYDSTQLVYNLSGRGFPSSFHLDDFSSLGFTLGLVETTNATKLPVTVLSTEWAFVVFMLELASAAYDGFILEAKGSYAGQVGAAVNIGQISGVAPILTADVAVLTSSSSEART